MSGKNPLGQSKEPQAYEGVNVIVPVGGWRLVKAARAPTSNDVKYPIGTIWVNTAASTAYILVATTPTWSLIEASGSGGVFTTLSSTGTTTLNTTGSAATTIGGGSGAVTINGGGSGTTTIGGSSGAITIASGAGGIAMTGGGNTIAIGNDAAANTVTIGTSNTTATLNLLAGSGKVNITGAVIGNSTVTASSFAATGDPGSGTASQNIISNVNSTTISTGVGSVKMSTANPGTNTGWLKAYIGTQVAWIPTWTTNAP